MQLRRTKILLLCLLLFTGYVNAKSWQEWQQTWLNTDFSKTTVNSSDILSGGPGKDGIPAIDHPQFVKVSADINITDEEPVIGVVIGDVAKAYPLRILMWHEIVNDKVGDTPVTVTYCPLCNTSIVFDRRLDEKLLDFGTTGNLRHSDLVMYDRQTESWWQQYAGEAIAGKLAGKKLLMIPSRLESFKQFRSRAPKGLVLVPNNPHARNYGANPYVGYDRSPFPFLFKGIVPDGVAPMMRVAAVNDVAFSLPLLRKKGHIKHHDIILSWGKGQRSALDTSRLEEGRDVGNVVVTRQGKDTPYVVTFAFAFFAFYPNGKLFTLDGELPRK